MPYLRMNTQYFQAVIHVNAFTAIHLKAMFLSVAFVYGYKDK